MTKQTPIKLDVKCPGCLTELTTTNAGGYRNYCEKCVDAMPPIPGGADENGYAQCYRIIGSYPDFQWVGSC